METFFTSYLFVNREMFFVLFSLEDGGSNTKPFAFWGQELTLSVALVIWLIGWVFPLLLVFVFLFYVPG